MRGGRRVVVSCYSWAPAVDSEPGPLWFYRNRRVYEQGVAIESMPALRRGRFGASMDAAPVERVHWGTVALPLAGPQAQLQYGALPAYGLCRVRSAMWCAADRNRWSSRDD